ncbi:Transforming growth factor-beta receptor-associated protein 1-like protein [Thalictrum thalictroides]|uniref:Transforming growth factor-beta receptor-associated protein 1-like protein n=1 Tax=Thalictrum thalictroides TaxID=46969 RepID=A0A7J6VIG1_THATH|nr:Transforming growth factor-beta receptor-associated protein 1-like protein [Thalictrum thalictroides]
MAKFVMDPSPNNNNNNNNSNNNKSRTVLEPAAELELPLLSKASSSAPIVQCLAICTLSDSQTLVYVGTQSGTLILFSCNPNSSNSTPLSFSRSSLVVTDRSLRSIHTFANNLKVLILSEDGFIFLLDSFLTLPVQRLNFPKGVSVVAPRLCSDLDSTLFGSTESDINIPSGGRRLLQKFSGGGSRIGIRSAQSYGGVKSSLDSSLEFPSSSTTNTSDAINNNCLVAFAVGKRLILIQLVLPLAATDAASARGPVSVVLKEIQCVHQVKTMVWINDSIIVGTAVDGYTLYSCVTGQNASMFSLPDPSSTPYLKSLCRGHEALLLVDNVGIIVNALGEPLGGSFIFRHVPNAIGEISSYLIAVMNGRMDLYHKKTGLCIQSVSFAGQGVGPCFVVNEESRKGQFVIVASSSNSKVFCFRKVSAEEQIKDLLKKKRFKEAIALVEELELEGEMTKEMLSFVHAQVGFLLLFDLHFEEAVDHFLQSETMQPSELFPFILPDPNRWSMEVSRNRYWGLHPPPVPLEDVVDEGLMAIQRAIYLRKAGVETAEDEYFLLSPPSRSDLLESAIENFIRYLWLSRDKDLTPSVREGVDTLLMYLYRALNRIDKMELLASSENDCVVEELETLLEDSGHLRTLAYLYASKRLSSKALAIWRMLAKNYSAYHWEDTSAEHASQDACADVVSRQMAAAIEASKLLEVSSDQDMVLQHLGWVADVDHKLAVLVLTSDKRASKLSPVAVIAAIDPKKVDILQRYLQWLIEDQDSDDAQFHTLYALSLAKSALESTDTGGYSGAIMSQEINAFDVEGSKDFSSTVRKRLQMFLQSSDLYDPDEVLDLIEGSEFWLEKAILYRKLGQETLVLQILALKLEDSEAAEQYCVDIGRQDAYKQLLDMYLDPQDGKDPMFEAAIHLLHNHGESLNPRQILETLSPDMPLQLASNILLKMLRARVHHHCQGQVVSNMSGAINIDAKLARLVERSRHVQINDESLCDSCHARLGTKLFAMYPDDAIVCYKCFRRQGESTSVTGRNFKQDIMFKPGWLVSP